MIIAGIDLAWGERKPDGVCILRCGARSSVVTGFHYPRGDDALVDCVRGSIPADAPALLTIDAPLVMPNATGMRPVDRHTHELFHREHAACHPANTTKCPRPPRVLARLAELGFRPGWEFPRPQAVAGAPPVRLAAEVYPHPAMVRLFRLPRILKYKKGRVRARRAEFRRLQRLLRELLGSEFPGLDAAAAEPWLKAPWSKAVEDRVDAFFCALIGLWHWRHRGRRSQVLGDLQTGFILLPEDLRRCRPS